MIAPPPVPGLAVPYAERFDADGILFFRSFFPGAPCLALFRVGFPTASCFDSHGWITWPFTTVWFR